MLYASFKDYDGNVITTDFQYMKPERNLVFPDAQLNLSITSDGYLKITTDRFARCIELGGNDSGDEFGWYFDDNYFDLMPFETKKIKIYGKHNKGFINAKAHYATRGTQIEYNCKL